MGSSESKGDSNQNENYEVQKIDSTAKENPGAKDDKSETSTDGDTKNKNQKEDSKDKGTDSTDKENSGAKDDKSETTTDGNTKNKNQKEDSKDKGTNSTDKEKGKEKTDSTFSIEVSIKIWYRRITKTTEAMLTILKGQTQTTFSLFRLTDGRQAEIDLEQYRPTLVSLSMAGDSLFTKDMLQKVSNAIRTHGSWKPVHIAAYVGLHQYFENLKEEIQTKRNTTIDDQTTDGKLSPLMLAVKGKNSECVRILLELGANIGLEDLEGDTVYHHAVQYYPEVIDTLKKMDQSKEPNKTMDQKNKKGWTALCSACRNSDSECVAQLLKAGANPNIIDSDGLHPIFIALERGDNKSVEHIYAEDKKQLKLVDKKYGGTLLHWTVNRKMIFKLSEEGLDINAQNKDGLTPLHIMQRKERSECIFELLILGADVNKSDGNGNTPLHFAVMSGDIELTKTFLVFDANVNVRNKEQKSPRHVASTSNTRNKELIVHMLDVCGAFRCDDQDQNCTDLCSKYGKSNGQQDPHIKTLLDRERNSVIDDMQNLMVKSNDETGDRLLSLDGGGIRGIVLCDMLLAIEKEVGGRIQDHFDWIAGTSTGGMLALALCKGMSLREIKHLYFKLKEDVFTGSLETRSVKLNKMLKDAFGEETVMTDLYKDGKPRAMVTGLLADRIPSKLHLFKTYTTEEDDTDFNLKETKDQSFFCPLSPNEQKVWEAARASGAAPSYFKPLDAYLDGGLAANNPTLDLMTECCKYNLASQTSTDIGVVLSLGTGQGALQKNGQVNVYQPVDLSIKEILIKTLYSIPGMLSFGRILLDQATVTEGRPVETAKTFCRMLHVPFFRFNPPITEVAVDEHDDRKLIQMMWETQCFIWFNKERISQVAARLKRRK